MPRGGRRRDAVALCRQQRIRAGDAVTSEHWKAAREVIHIDETGVQLRIPSFRRGRPNGCLYQHHRTLPMDTRKVTARSWSTDHRVRELERRVAQLEAMLVPEAAE